jgi:hypothetical protein
MESDDPNDVKLSTESADANRAVPRSESEEDAEKKSSTDILEPSVTRLKTLMLLPSLSRQRRESVEPYCAKSNTLVFEPNVAAAKTESADPARPY